MLLASDTVPLNQHRAHTRPVHLSACQAGARQLRLLKMGGKSAADGANRDIQAGVVAPPVQTVETKSATSVDGIMGRSQQPSTPSRGLPIVCDTCGMILTSGELANGRFCGCQMGAEGQPD